MTYQAKKSLLIAAIVAAFACIVLMSCKSPEATIPEEGEASEPTTLAELADQINGMPEGSPLKLLFAVSAKSATVTKLGDNRRELAFSIEDVSSIVAFTDRPERHAFNLTASMLATIWDSGSDSFALDPPNAVVEDSRARVGVTEVTGFAVADEAVTVQLNRMAYKSVDDGDSLDGEVEGVTVFIDSSWLKVSGAGIALGLQQAAKACVSVDCEFWPLGG